MRFLNILHAINFEPWLIVPEVHAQLAALVESKLAGDASSLSERATAGKNIFGDPLPQMSISDGIATIPISGPIGKGLGNLEKSCGATSIEDVQRNLAEASSRKDVRGVLLSINSPGGSITGIPETASMIARLRETKPVVAFTDGMMASAAYWLGSQADAVVASTSAQVGSIGVYIPWADQTRRYEAAGVKVGVVKNKEEALSLLTRRDHLRNRIVDTGSEIKRLRTKAASIEHKKQRVARNVERCLQLNNPDKLSWPGLAAEGPMLAALDFAAAEIARRLALAVEADRRAHEENEEFLRKHADDLALVEA